MERKRRDQKDRTGIIISVVVHAVVIGGLLFWLSTTEMGKELIRRGLQAVRSENKKQEEPPKPPPSAKAPPPLPKINEGVEPKSAGGSRRAVASDAPAAVGESFFVDSRTQTTGPSTGSGDGGKTNVQIKVAPPAAPRVTLPAFRPPPVSSIKQTLAERAKSSTVVESFGTEQISKSGASDAGEIVGRVSGASVADGKFAVVRGLADRYTATTLNGADVPSADPNRRAAQLDLFPAQFIDRIDVSKTFTPDMPGGFVGGLINIVTKPFPDKFVFSLSGGGSYNTQASLRDDFLFNDQGKTDWLAMDDGTRELPAAVAATSPSGNQELNPAIKSSFGSRQFSPLPGDSPLNSSFSLAFGDTTYLFGRRLGFLAGVNYKNDYNHYADGSITKYDGQGRTSFPKTDVKSVIEYSWGSLATLAYELADNHQLNFNFMYVQTAEDEARRIQGQDSTLSTEPGVSYVDQSILHWTERNLTYFQFKGQHELPEVRDIKFDWVTSLSSTTQDEPDHRIFQFFADPSNNYFGPDGPSRPSRPTRIWRDLQDDNVFVRGDLTIPVPSYNSQDNSFKTGLALSQSEQTYSSRVIDSRTDNAHPFITSGNPADYLAAQNEQYIHYFNFPANFQYLGEQTISAWYLMGNWGAFEWLKMVGGVRHESTDITVTTDNLTLANAQTKGEISQKDFLPSLSATFMLRTNLQLRAAWSQTLVRPTYREFSRAELYDVAQGRTIVGNPDLTMSSSENYDLRLEWYPRPGEIVSLGVFMKTIDSPIELASEDTQNLQVSYKNYEKADLWGVEFEFRKDLGTLWHPLTEFSVGLNYAYIKSEVDRTQVEQANQILVAGKTTETRPLYDQPEYVINGDLTWDHPASGTSFTINGGVVGRRLILVGLGTPDEYEEPAPYLDISLTQKIGRRWKAKFSAKNLLDPVYKVTQEWQAGELSTKEYTKGMSFGLSLTYDF